MNHITLAAKYATLLNDRLGFNLDSRLLEYVAYAHDTLKEDYLKPGVNRDHLGKYEIPDDLNRYVRMNLDILNKFDVDAYFNTDASLHALASGIFLVKCFEIENPEIIYPVIFHSCPIMEVYKQQTEYIRNMVDIILLSDKLSSNYLKIQDGIKLRCDLDKIVFGEDGRALNYELGLVIAKLIGMSKVFDKQSKASLDYYCNRLKQINPLMARKDLTIKSLGGLRIWEKRNSPVWRIM
jgi:predicted nucleic-acid-binding Zn-ribbon protein